MGRWRTATGMWLLLAMAGVCRAEIPAALAISTYTHRTLVMRGLVAGSELDFDAKGKLTGGDGRRVPFTLACVYVEKMQRTGERLEITARRVGLFDPKADAVAFQSVPLVIGGAYVKGDFYVRRPAHEAIVVTVKGARSEDDFLPALKRIFATSWEEVGWAAPVEWQRLMHRDVKDPFADAEPAEALHMDSPVLVNSEYSDVADSAGAVGATGVCVVKALIGPDGLPLKVRIVKPIGLGLDERAVAMVLKQKFAQPVKDGKPVQAAMDVAVRFEMR